MSIFHHAKIITGNYTLVYIITRKMLELKGYWLIQKEEINYLVNGQIEL